MIPRAQNVAVEIQPINEAIVNIAHIEVPMSAVVGDISQPRSGGVAGDWGKVLKTVIAPEPPSTL